MSSSGGSSNKKNTQPHGCWEEAGQEFYQENYSVSDADLDPQSTRNFSTLLPSKQTRNGKFIFTFFPLKNGKYGNYHLGFRK